MKLTPRRLVAILLLFPFLAVMAWLCINFSASRSRLSRFKTSLSQNGEKFELEAVLPHPVAFDQNGVGIFRRAMSAIYPSGTYSGVLSTNPPEAMVMVAPGKAAVGWQQKLIRHQATNNWEEILAELEQDEDGLRELEQIIDKPAFDFQLNYSQGFNMLLPHLSELKRAAQELKSAALCDLHRGDAASAVKRIRASVAMAKAMEEPPSTRNWFATPWLISRLPQPGNCCRRLPRKRNWASYNVIGNLSIFIPAPNVQPWLNVPCWKTLPTKCAIRALNTAT